MVLFFFPTIYIVSTYFFLIKIAIQSIFLDFALVKIISLLLY